MKSIIYTAVATLGLAACMNTAVFPVVPTGDASGTLACASVGKLANTDANRSDGVAQNAAGLRAHPVKLCKGNTEVGTALVWSGTNAEGNRLTTKPTDLSGNEHHLMEGTGYDPKSGTNLVVFEVADADGMMLCTAVKPSGGISPFKVASCV